jgi:hypothetical protein
MFATRTLAALSLIIIAQAGILFYFGQPAICECGYIKFWEGIVKSAGNSQHLSDWYTFSHVIHGFIFYWILWKLFPKMHIGWRLLLAVAIEVGWEIFENTPMIINHYRQQALAQGYTGDSIVNSVSDSLAMVFGFIIARVSPVWITITLLLAMEIFVAYMIRDNLVLNIINLIHVFPAIENWQMGA